MKISPRVLAIVVAMTAAVGGGCIFTEREEPRLVQVHDDPHDDPEDPTPPQSMLCTPGEQRACYEGPPGTAGVGICREGLHYCRPDGNDYWACEGSVLPEAENCGDGIDNDCDGWADDTDDCFVNRGLVTRHFIDEADGGTAPSSLMDAAPEPVDLYIDYDLMEFVEDGPRRRGLRWWDEYGYGRARSGVDGTKLRSRLHGARAMTIEIVANVEQSGSPGESGVIVSLGDARIAYRWYYEELELYECSGCPRVMREFIPELGRERVVIHVVVDYEAAPSSQWVQVYVNGMLQGTALSSPYRPAIELPPGASYILGQSEASPSSFVGTIYYAAIYDAAFTEAEAFQNAQQLLIDDDRH